MHACVETQDWDKLKDMILAGYREDISNYDYKDYPLIFDVIRSDDPGASEMACWWLDHGYPHHVTGGRVRKTIAHAAAAAGLPDVLRKLKALGADLNLGDDDGNTPLWDAVCRGQAECVLVLLDTGVDPDGFEERPDDLSGRGFDTPLGVAASAEIAEMLLDAGADMSIGMYPDSVIDEPKLKHFEDELISPLSRACLDGRKETAEFLLARGADADANDGQAMRCLAIAENPPIALLDALIKAGADVNGKEGKEPLRLAAISGNGGLCAALLKAGAKPAADALPLSVRSGKWEAVEALLKGKIGKGSDAIRMAAKVNRREILDRLLDIYPGEGLGAALHGAIAGCRFELAKEIIDMGVDPDARDEGGMTPLIRLFSLDRRVDTWRRFVNSPKKYVLEPASGTFPGVPAPGSWTSRTTGSLPGTGRETGIPCLSCARTKRWSWQGN